MSRFGGLAAGARRRTGGAPPPATDPTTVAGLVNRWRADSIAQTNGTAVASWPALTGGVALAQATAGVQPTYVTSSIGGKPAVRFVTASNQRLNATITGRAQPYTIVIVHKLARTADPIQQLWEAGSQIITLAPGYDAWAGTDLTGGTSTTNPTILTWVANNTTSRLLINSTQVAAAPSGTGAITTSLVVGNNAGNTRALDGDIAEILVYTGAKTDTELSTIDTYVREFYGNVFT